MKRFIIVFWILSVFFFAFCASDGKKEKPSAGVVITEPDGTVKIMSYQDFAQMKSAAERYASLKTTKPQVRIEETGKRHEYRMIIVLDNETSVSVTFRTE